MVELRIVSLAAAALARDVTGGRSGPPSRQISRTNSFSGNLEDASFSGSHAPNNGSMAGVPAGFDPLLSQNRNISGGAVSNVSLTSAAAQSLSALDFNFGAVRLSTTSLYFPTTFLTACGSFVVSNVLCVMNSTESSIISLRVVVSERNGGCMAALAPEVAARNRARSVSPSSNAASAEGITTCKDLLLVHPREAVTLRPQQRAFFSITWGVGKRPISTQSLQHNVAVQLQMQRSSNEPSIPPIDLELHCAQPQPDEMHRPFHYWVNTTMVSNRTLHEELELPYVRSVLPVFLLLQKLEAATAAGGARSPDGPASSRGGATEGEDESMFIRDKDKGALVMVRGGGHAKTTPGSSFAGLGPASPAALGAAVGGSSTETSGRQLQPWEVRLRSRPPKVDIVSGVVRCIIHMGQLRGLPMVVNSSSSLSTTGGINGNAGGSSNATNAPPSSPRFEETGGSNDFNGSSSQGSAPAFRVSLSPLQRGWSVTRSETTPAYQAQSGALNWVGDTLEALKQPDAVTAQCLRLDLYEVNLADDDAIPIGCALISIPPTPKIPEVMRLPVAFYVYDSYSMYDKLSTTSLLFKDVALEVRPASVVAD